MLWLVDLAISFRWVCLSARVDICSGLDRHRHEDVHDPFPVRPVAVQPGHGRGGCRRRHRRRHLRRHRRGRRARRAQRAERAGARAQAGHHDRLGRVPQRRDPAHARPDRPRRHHAGVLPVARARQARALPQRLVAERHRHEHLVHRRRRRQRSQRDQPGVLRAGAVAVGRRDGAHGPQRRARHRAPGSPPGDAGPERELGPGDLLVPVVRRIRACRPRPGAAVPHGPSAGAVPGDFDAEQGRDRLRQRHGHAGGARRDHGGVPGLADVPGGQQRDGLQPDDRGHHAPARRPRRQPGPGAADVPGARPLPRRACRRHGRRAQRLLHRLPRRAALGPGRAHGRHAGRRPPRRQRVRRLPHQRPARLRRRRQQHRQQHQRPARAVLGQARRGLPPCRAGSPRVQSPDRRGQRPRRVRSSSSSRGATQGRPGAGPARRVGPHERPPRRPVLCWRVRAVISCIYNHTTRLTIPCLTIPYHTIPPTPSLRRFMSHARAVYVSRSSDHLGRMFPLCVPCVALPPQATAGATWSTASGPSQHHARCRKPTRTSVQINADQVLFQVRTAVRRGPRPAPPAVRSPHSAKPVGRSQRARS